MGLISFDFDGEVSQRGEIVRAIDGLAQTDAWTEAHRVAVQVCVDELLANIAMHAVRADPGVTGTLRIASQPEQIEITLTDTGPQAPAAPRSPRAQTRAGVAIGGRGLILVGKLMDTADFSRDNDINRVVLVKYRRPVAGHQG